MRMTLAVLAVTSALGACVPTSGRDASGQLATTISKPASTQARIDPSVGERPAGFTIKLVSPWSHGSGVHIGKGYVLTASHVVASGVPVYALLDNGQRQNINVLWRNREYDIAMIRLESSSGISAVSLSCQIPSVGTTFTAHGSTMSSSFVALQGSFMNGPDRVSNWKSVMMTERGVRKGMSGGGVIQDGRLVGVSVGVVDLLDGKRPPPGGIGLVVPGTTLCMLAGRR